MVTIKDVAKLANVAPSTVSRVIANNPRISEKTKRRVREVMEELGYHPNFQARNLASKSSKSIGVIMPNSTYHAFQNPFFPEVLRGISMNAHENLFGIYLSTGSTEEEIHEEIVSMVQGRRVDGIVMLYSRVNDLSMRYLHECQFPFTVVGRPYENEDRVTFVDNDNIYITKQVTNYLIQLGHRDVAIIGGSKDFVVTLDRINGYKKALEEAGISFRPEYIVHEDSTKNSIKTAVTSLMALPSPPTGIVTMDDMVAYEATSHLEKLGLLVPHDISIVGFNNLMLSEHSKPPLTSVDTSTYELGYHAANCLIEKIKEPSMLAKRITIPTKFIERKSCAQRGTHNI
ncbi:LacI family DNA-binding transcriptional regulator [Metabacillus halosaccharovorans]|uniref:LacI family transcriptional regulator n=1 Tax=Metabacillus halosaccharovorans TaxID=930124 RepID=A0ABT3DGH5_9BACI|nr:LacI family DNA-binding transcriptional regulator [Metabacillus halosaccharovorans]MCV9886168.1 LacI family transcriptional regulator [Metabacillus halosaccharovorans]